MHGNVYEWVADCWHDHYNGAPSDGSAWMEEKCELVQIRGNDWGEPPIFSRSGNRNNAAPATAATGSASAWRANSDSE